MTRRTHISEDDFHRLQTPRASTPTSEPATGNATVNDNLVESVLIALYSVNPVLRDQVRVHVSDHYVTLTGTIDTIEQRRSMEAAIKAVPGVIGISDLCEIAPNTLRASTLKPDLTITKVKGRPMIYVTRYCSTEPPSVAAAIRQAAETLDAFLQHLGLQLPDETIVIYRNRHHDTLVVDVGYPLDVPSAKSTTGEVKSGRTPAGSMITLMPDDGVEGMLAAYSRLMTAAQLAKLAPTDVAWQWFAMRPEHLHRDYPAVPVNVQVRAPRRR